ncbi:hypothetical protein Lser_V15G36025 [Lactuca serriola]
MAFPKETSQPVISIKRPLDDADDCELDEFRKPKTVARKYPPPKIRIGVEAVRDFPPGCGILQDSDVSKVEKKPLKRLENVESNIEHSTSHGKDKVVNSQSFEDNKLNSCIKPKGLLGFKKPSFGSRQSGKVKFWDPTKQVVHDFPPVSGIKPERKPLKNLDNFDSDLKKLNSIDKVKLVDSHPFENNKLKSFKPKESGINNNPTGKVKYWDPTSSNAGDTEISKHINTEESRKEQVRREKIRDAMILFETVYTQLFQENGSKQQGEKIAHWRVPMEAAKIVKQKLKWMNADKALGQIRGVQPGDRFKFRSQLQMIGLHCQSHCGIDYTKINGKNLAISIVDSHRYSNASESCDVLSYCGEGGGGGGGVGFFGSKRQVAPDDQKLERGNLALKNSMDEKSPVRVIRKLVGVGKNNTDVFVYDGLYTVEHCTQKRGSEGKMVFMFQLQKMPGQPQVQKMVNALHHHSTFQML